MQSSVLLLKKEAVNKRKTRNQEHSSKSLKNDAGDGKHTCAQPKACGCGWGGTLYMSRLPKRRTAGRTSDRWHGKRFRANKYHKNNENRHMASTHDQWIMVCVSAHTRSHYNIWQLSTEALWAWCKKEQKRKYREKWISMKQNVEIWGRNALYRHRAHQSHRTRL